MVKKFFSIIAMFALLLTSCETPNEEVPAQFHFTSNAEIVQIATGGCFNVSYVIDEVVEGATVTATPSVEWIHINGDITETDIPICIDDNYGEQRTGTVVVKYANTTATITVTQKLCKIAINTADLEKNLGAGSSCININYSLRQTIENATVSVFADPDSAEWLHANPATESMISFCTDDNTGEARTGYLYVAYDDDMITITINQAGL